MQSVLYNEIKQLKNWVLQLSFLKDEVKRFTEDSFTLIYKKVICKIIENYLPKDFCSIKVITGTHHTGPLKKPIKESNTQES